MRYLPYRWHQEDEDYNNDGDAGVTHGLVCCNVCYTICGVYRVGETIIVDTRTTATYHMRCVPSSVLIEAGINGTYTKFLQRLKKVLTRHT